MGADGAGDTPGEDSKLTGIDEARRRIAEAARTGATVLNLSGLDLTEVPDELYALGQLKMLDLNGNPIGADGARAIATLTGLTSLYLGANQIGANGACAITALTGLTSLYLWDNQIGDDGARAIAALTGLTSLDLGRNQIGDDGARAIAALTGLTSLNLARNQIGDGARALLEIWADRGMSQLERLHIGRNDIGDLGAPAETIESGDAQAILAPIAPSGRRNSKGA